MSVCLNTQIPKMKANIYRQLIIICVINHSYNLSLIFDNKSFFNQYPMEQLQTSEQRLPNKTGQTLEKYKKKLLAQVITIFLICLVIILERVFYQLVIEAEQRGLAKLQIYNGLVQVDQDKVIATGIKNGFLQFFDSLSEFSVQFLLLTHYLATLFVCVDSLLATKITYISMGLIYAISVLQMFYTGSRPYWSENEILSSRCLSSYNHPSLGPILMLFTPAYTYYCWQKYSLQSETKNKFLPRKYLIAFIVLILVTLATQFINFMTGTMYISNIVLSLVIGLLLFMLAISGDQIIQKAIKKSTIFKTQAKKYVFYWLLFICLLATFVLIVFSGEDLFLDIDWVENYMNCTRYLQYPKKIYRFDQMIGPWFNFIQTSALFGWIGAVFGISASFRKINNINWAGGSMKKRIIRGIITNALIIPSWIFIAFIQFNGEWIKTMGLNTYLVNSIHFFILYIWIFGYMPVYLLHKTLKLTNNQQSDFYVILQQKVLDRQA